MLKALDLPASALFSTLGRTAARGIETQLVAQWSLEFFDQLMKNLENGDSRMANPVMWEKRELAETGARGRPLRSSRAAHWLISPSSRTTG